ncbi:flagellar biosynthesis protein FlhB [Bordetella trematum]|uniref:Flagellar biosynthetic protein FlhB n=1 Tax=Bordetella trematum TaxID=123899 RepID=A0A157R6L0_9BORD|nr:flagellar biosynthesis protein FlhB [Bordetella trematum]AUL47388.1 flagellar biosynthesis protein FlhB [Bordetella trematum]AZR94251.1 flagellar biosynthesis protein FlhB [Bordetella trematum]NNH21325.1 flagellar type III secretion system protein FlhB [Bordetella trematum]QIM72792.1 flagellar type III secretion system protein FlhB [Bordetella trematum]SAI53617.1 flagellar biosynthetic protein FlhB [Bordetella trematum]
MAEESDLEKTEAASPRRLEKAREEGQIARSRELTTFLMLAVGVSALWLSASFLYQGLSGVLRRALGFETRVTQDPGAMVSLATQGAGEALWVVLPVFGALAIAAVLGSVALGGLVFSAKPMAFKLSKLNPLSGLKRIFSAQTLVELVKAMLKAFLVGGVAASAIWYFHDDMLGLMHAAPAAALPRALHLVALCCALIVAALLLVPLLDVPWQIWSHLKKLRMSKEDVRQEHKESDGDPHIKARIRQQQRAMARRRMMTQVPLADVVVTNPTHYAVALRYEEGAGSAPRVIAKGSGLVAARIREIAADSRVPTLEAPPLARALHQHVELGQEIPVALYTAVAEVLAWVFQLRSWRAGEGEAPSAPATLPVPAELDPGAQGV